MGGEIAHDQLDQMVHEKLEDRIHKSKAKTSSLATQITLINHMIIEIL